MEENTPALPLCRSVISDNVIGFVHIRNMVYVLGNGMALHTLIIAVPFSRCNNGYLRGVKNSPVVAISNIGGISRAAYLHVHDVANAGSICRCRYSTFVARTYGAAASRYCACRPTGRGAARRFSRKHVIRHFGVGARSKCHPCAGKRRVGGPCNARRFEPL